MKKKIMDVNIPERASHYICIYDDQAETNAYRLYDVWWGVNGQRRKLIDKYGNFDSVMLRLLQLFGYRKIEF